MLHDKKVKIVATIGPSSDSPETILKLAEEGVNIFRINLSHSQKDWILPVVEAIRSAEKKLKQPLSIMGDLAGPKIRIGDVIDGLVLQNDDEIEIVTDEVMGTHARITINYPKIIKQLEKGAEIYIDDGRIKLEVRDKTPNGVMAKIMVGGEVKPRKGFYAQGISLDLKELSEKDKNDLKMMHDAGADAMAVSFVQTADDIEQVRTSLPKECPMMLVAKIETAKAIENIDSIIEATDAIMIARGDLGLAVPIQEVPYLQKTLITKCLEQAKPVITATQMLESMTHNPMPTRAEVTDVANAILDGTDAVMLSAETATGEFPVETVKMMVRIIRTSTPHIVRREYFHEHAISNAVTASIGRIADQIEAKLIIAFTEKGTTARRISRNRYPEAIIALSPDLQAVRKMNFSWGVFPHLIDRTRGFEHMRTQGKEIARKNYIEPLKKGESFVIAAGMPFGQAGSTNMVFIEKV
jgi:pyruvate kinase